MDMSPDYVDHGKPKLEIRFVMREGETALMTYYIHNPISKPDGLPSNKKKVARRFSYYRGNRVVHFEYQLGGILVHLYVATLVQQLPPP